MPHALLLSREDQLAVFGPFDNEEAAETYSKILADVMKQDPEAVNDKIAIVAMVNPHYEAPRIVLVNP